MLILNDMVLYVVCEPSVMWVLGVWARSQIVLLLTAINNISTWKMLHSINSNPGPFTITGMTFCFRENLKNLISQTYF